MDNSKLDTLFLEYERDFANLDFEAIARSYATNFISAGPRGIISQSKKEFIAKAAQAAQFYRSIGQNSAELISKKVIPISNEYCMVTIHWGVTFEKTGDRMVEFNVSYIVQQLNGQLSIILFISHEDEEEAMKKLGLKPATLN